MPAIHLSPASGLVSITLLAVCILLSGCDTIFSSAGEEVCTVPVVRIMGVEVTPIDRREERGRTHFLHTDTLLGQVAFQIEALSKEVGEREVSCADGPLVDSRPGFTTNPVRIGPRVLRFDQPIVARGARIEPGTNLMEVEALSDDYSLRRAFSPFSINEIHLDRATYELSSGTYRGYFEWVTREEEDEVFSDSVEVYIDLP